MPSTDYTWCADGKDCPECGNCFRYTAAPKEGPHSWANFYEAQGDDCEAYIPVKWEPRKSEDAR